MIGPLRIESLAAGGAGVGRWQGKTVFVPLAAPDDLVSCRLIRDRKRYSEAELVETIAPSPRRRTPPCPVFSECGGCQWQHLPYSEQCRWKGRIFAETLGRLAKVPAELVQPLVAAPDEWGYRSRLQFKCRQTRDGFVMGFYRRGSHFVIDVPHCPIAAPRLNEVLALFRSWLPASPCPERIPQVDLEIDDEGRVRATVHHVDQTNDALAFYLVPLAEAAGLDLFLQRGRKDSLVRLSGGDRLHIRPLAGSPLRLAYGAGGFAQVNLEQNRSLVRTVVDEAARSEGGRFLDLFCGMGNFTLPLSRQAREIVGIEDYAPAIAMARANAAANGIGNARFLACPAEGVDELLEREEAFDLVVLDPPRDGAYDVCRSLARRRPPPRIIYVSCDPATLARDLVPLLHAGYRLRRTVPFDLFPQTWHIESITLLELD